MVHLFLLVGSRPLFPMFIETRPTLFWLKFPPKSLHTGKEGGKRTIECGKIPVQPILGDYYFQRAFESTWYSIPIYVKGFTTVQGFCTFSWHWNMIFSTDSLLENSKKYILQRILVTFTFSCALDSFDYFFFDKRSGIICIVDILGQDVDILHQFQFGKFNQYLVVGRALS